MSIVVVFIHGDRHYDYYNAMLEAPRLRQGDGEYVISLFSLTLSLQLSYSNLKMLIWYLALSIEY